MSFQNPSYPGGSQGLGALSADKEPDEDKAKKKVTKRVVNKQIAIAAVFALVLAGIVGVLVLGSGNGTWVAVAKAPINAGTAISGDQVGAVSTSAGSLVPNSFTGGSSEEAVAVATQALSNNPRSRENIQMNQQLSTDQFGPDKLLAEGLTPDERLVSTSATVGNAVAGNITAGDLVDVIGTVGGVTGVIASRVPVVSATVSQDKFDAIAGKQTSSDKDVDPHTLLPGKPVPGIYVLRVPSAAALKIVAATEDGAINLLWQGQDSTAIPPTALTGKQAVCEGSTTC